MVEIAGGRFLMGSEEGRDDESPSHWVELSPFAIGRHAVSNQEFAAFLSDSAAKPPPCWTEPSFNHPQQPVVSVSWFDAVDFCDWLSQCCGRRYRLPTEAEREMACRAGKRTAYPWGDSPGRELGDYGRRWATGGPDLVGGPANDFQLYNMADNVHEWCLDWYSKEYYRESPTKDPRGPASGQRRASRGGSWRHQVKVTRSAARSSLPPDYRYSDYGFRLAADL
jgi:formylglycine-generating enzyme required for sulfatase activity